ncbi:hypothetical protein K443DRAFT_7384 [Laccaria amethystina LaAM-08-1]|uniref:Uncharacterized protein n=1 Tax=Laccaria amethystina LaAM-08-1 TaxID=1095629 RepID=A0A0C9XY69_9AGAR|nr:hypothetical protein K443DRAFT_7384 [Laccaria amethystina LaAM-08-1]
MAAFLPRPVLIFNSGETMRRSRRRLFFFVVAADHQQRQVVHRSRRRLLSASLGALRPSPAGLMSVQTSSAPATQARHTQGLSLASSAKREDFSGCAPRERLSSALHREMRGRGNRVTAAARERNQRATQRGCM